jgi:hypothetical protein
MHAAIAFPENFMQYASLARSQPAMHDIERLLGSASLVAHLLTGSVEHAESAAMAAIESWDPDNETEDALYQKVLLAAAKAETRGSNADAAALSLPGELRAILNLETNMRRCFVLHILVGMAVQACARLLRLSPLRVREFTCAGLKLLSQPTRVS